MATPLSKDGLENLDRSDLDAAQLVDHAASVLRVNLVEATKDHVEHPDQETSTTDYTFREQWVLRWLLRRFVSEHNLKTDEQDVDTSSVESSPGGGMTS